MLDKSIIYTNLTQITKNQIHEIKILNSVTSTNDILLDEIKSSPQKIIALFAEEQTHGRGRLGRTWISPPNTNIYLSLSWHFQKPVSQLSKLSVMIAKIIIRALKNVGITHPIEIKHPNDLIYKNKKLGGILIETINLQAQSCSAVIGIGLNVNFSAENNDKIDQPWTSLSQITHTQHDRNLISAHLLNALCETLNATY